MSLNPMRKNRKKRLVVVSSTGKMVRFFLVNHLKALSKEYKVFVVCNLEKQRDILDVLPDSIKVIHVPIKRQISLLSDFLSLFQIVHFIYKNQITAIYSISPKGGLLAAASSWFLRVPVRVHVFTGQVWVTKRGFNRMLLKFLDRLISIFSTDIIVDSHSQKRFLEKQKIIKKDKALVIGNGSISGVNTKKFYPSQKIRDKIRVDLKSGESIVFLFVGRLKRDKGVFELIKAFNRVREKIECVELWLVGDDEEEVQNQAASLDFNLDNVRFFGYVTDPQVYMQAADIFCLTSYREGFGSSVIEAAACKVPSIGSRIYGLTDAIVDKKTGLLVNVGDVDDIFSKMLLLSENAALRKEMGEFAYANVISKFDADKVTDQLSIFLRDRILKAD